MGSLQKRFCRRGEELMGGSDQESKAKIFVMIRKNYDLKSDCLTKSGITKNVI